MRSVIFAALAALSLASVGECGYKLVLDMYYTGISTSDYLFVTKAELFDCNGHVEAHHGEDVIFPRSGNTATVLAVENIRADVYNNVQGSGKAGVDLWIGNNHYFFQRPTADYNYDSDVNFEANTVKGTCQLEYNVSC
ncbi:hypothetical protein BGZ73_006693 [Actinomortierella ambigua]|nr:hypothetical protein BGZ73_006693 [Actinomortierella ambigua]